MPENTDTTHQKKQDALKSAWLYTLICGGSGAMLLYLRIKYSLGGFWGPLVVI